jgi:hypothetical protein
METLGYEVRRDCETGAPSYETIRTEIPQEKFYEVRTLYPRVEIGVLLVLLRAMCIGMARSACFISMSMMGKYYWVCIWVEARIRK